MSLNGLATVLWRQGHIDKAKTKYLEAFARFRDAGDRSHEAVSQNNYAIALQDSGNLLEAKHNFEASLAAYREIGDKISIARELGNLGELLIRLGDLDQSERDLSEQLAVAKERNDGNQSAYALLDLANVALIRDKLGDARRQIADSIAIRQKLGKKGLVAEAKAEQADILYESGDYVGSEMAAREAIAEFQHEKEVDEEADSWAILSKILLRAGRGDDAINTLATAVSLGEGSQDCQVRLSVLIAEGMVYSGLGHKGHAREKLETALVEAERLGDVSQILDAKLQIALGQMDGKSRSASVADATELQRESQRKGFSLVARRVSSILGLSRQGST